MKKTILAVVGICFAAWGAPVLRVMPLGDSITNGTGSNDTAGYRGFLWTFLKNAGYNVDFVGSAGGSGVSPLRVATSATPPALADRSLEGARASLRLDVGRPLGRARLPVPYARKDLGPKEFSPCRERAEYAMIPAV